MRTNPERLELIIAEGVYLQQTIESCKARLEALHKDLAASFVGREATEHIATEFGTAVRVLDEKLILDPDSYPDVHAILGSQFDRYFETHLECVARPGMREALAASHSALSKLIGGHIRIQRNPHIVFTPIQAQRVVDLP